jgi:hypothetical protein
LKKLGKIGHCNISKENEGYLSFVNCGVKKNFATDLEIIILEWRYSGKSGSGNIRRGAVVAIFGKKSYVVTIFGEER